MEPFPFGGGDRRLDCNACRMRNIFFMFVPHMHQSSFHWSNPQLVLVDKPVIKSHGGHTEKLIMRTLHDLFGVCGFPVNKRKELMYPEQGYPHRVIVHFLHGPYTLLPYHVDSRVIGIKILHSERFLSPPQGRGRKLGTLFSWTPSCPCIPYHKTTPWNKHLANCSREQRPRPLRIAPMPPFIVSPFEGTLVPSHGSQLEECRVWRKSFMAMACRGRR